MEAKEQSSVEEISVSGLTGRATSWKADPVRPSLTLRVKGGKAVAFAPSNVKTALAVYLLVLLKNYTKAKSSAPKAKI